MNSLLTIDAKSPFEAFGGCDFQSEIVLGKLGVNLSAYVSNKESVTDCIITGSKDGAKVVLAVENLDGDQRVDTYSLMHDDKEGVEAAMAVAAILGLSDLSGICSYKLSLNPKDIATMTIELYPKAVEPGMVEQLPVVTAKLAG